MNRNDAPNPRTSSTPLNVDCSWVRDHAPVHALGALEPEEADRLERHLLLCRDCDREVAALMDVTALLGAGVAQAEPPASIKRNLMAAINVPAPIPSAEPVLFADFAAFPDAPVAPAVPAIHGRLGSRTAFASIVCALLLLGLWTINTHQQLGEQRTQVDRLERQNEALTVHLSSIQAGQQFFGNEGFWLPLSVVDANATEAGGIVMSGAQNTTTLLSVWNMPDEHDTYHVLCESKRGELLSAGEIQVNERGSGSVTLNLPAPVTEYRAVHVVPVESATFEADILTHDILQLLLGEPTAVATSET